MEDSSAFSFYFSLHTEELQPSLKEFRDISDTVYT